MKKFFKIFIALMMCVGTISLITNTNQTVEAKSYAKKYHLKTYKIPSRFWGKWYQGKDKINISKYRIDGYSTYRSKHTGILPYHKRVYLVEPHGKEIIVMIPQSDGFSLKRSGRSLIWYSMGTRVKYHRY
ncbi:hypothetical protein GCM10022297_16450 [Lactobacillus hamsteri]|uniref:Uncharacterized protein n=1 Tax=Lactobacillus hamsteri DSM 5661 = JCM 6256 TaxID=1423754 RepID=A0A0R1YEB7_9LACO|nr:hypothetical protein [Lactobacillus hamsteri]KRM40814.1 hypothetical protein FC39_GL000009 [Lactobacillus hamsteri DSM 5661 = JCM 6256]